MKDAVRKGLLIFPIIKDLNQADGILVKNEGIKKGFGENGVEIDVLEFNSNGIFNGDEKLFSFSPERSRRIYQYHAKIWKEIANYILGKEYDFIWFRVPAINIFIAGFVQRIKVGQPDCQIILEYGAYPFLNELSGVKKVFYLLNKPVEKKAHRFADYIITYCGQDQVDNLLNIPINNGIDLVNIPINTQKKPDLNKINLICVSSLKKWHAYERFIAGLPAYIKKDNHIPVHFNIVGNGPEYEKLVALTNNLGLDDLVTFHGFKTGTELDSIYQECHVAIGTLGFHRIGITNSSSLKNREYFARGLPIVLSTPDLDMPASLPFIKYVPENEEPVDISSVVAFAESCYQNVNISQQIRSYAENHVSWKSKIKTVLEYLNMGSRISKKQSFSKV
jgi:glycosyltransferase involved in cell wall biosynthesis